MASSATEWAWRESRASNGSLIVLLAIADEIDGKGVAEMTVMEIARKSRLSERAAQNALRDLERLRELSITGTGRRRNYAVTGAESAPLPASTGAESAPLPASTGAESAPLPASTGAESAPPQNLHPAESAPLAEVIHTPEPAQETAKPQASAVKGADSAPHGPVDNFSDDLDLGSVVSGGKSRSKSSSEPPREDVERLCQHLASRIEANGSKRPAVGKRWRDAARLLIDNDGRTEQQVMAAIDWCQQSEFWRANIMSMPKLREKYDTLRLQAQQEQRKKSQPARQQETDDQFKRAMERIKARKETANGAGGDGDDRPLRQVALPPAGD